MVLGGGSEYDSEVMYKYSSRNASTVATPDSDSVFIGPRKPYGTAGSQQLRGGI